MNTHARVLISGRVQGVYFRDGTRDEAYRLGVTGWIRNLPDKRVEAVFEGPDSAVSQLVAFCREGPAWARVDHLDIEYGEYTGTFSGFAILKTPRFHR
jgi:acylphosphatase